MAKHPLYSVFKQKPPSRDFAPINESNVLRSTSASSDFEKMGCLILAGGKGTRLGFNGPKGCFLIPLKEKKTLFQLLFEKILKKGEDLPVAIMTSPLNQDATFKYLEENHYFGLKNVSLFNQEMIPVCDDEGNLIDDVQSPDGNGKAFQNLVRSKIWEGWKARGIEFVQVLPIDNPKADPFDGELLKVHETEGVELVLRGIERASKDEKLGVIGTEKGKLGVLEYSELTEKSKDLGFTLGNTGVFSVSCEFIERIAPLDLPFHLAQKIENGRSVWKFETFIFDLFCHANSFKILISDRKKCFAPLKNRSGPDSLETVTKALMT
ncbi:MAG: UTP--glucose-1-phosphate uridylyltransferase [Simkaniaceae bacterium]|nr:UTP--glucose-1-phosphate uridylyltransferase [Simkaniaceae bacterium]